MPPTQTGGKAPDHAAIKKVQRRNLTVLIVAIVAVLVAGAILIGYFVTQSHLGNSPSNASGNTAVGAAAPVTTEAGSPAVTGTGAPVVPPSVTTNSGNTPNSATGKKLFGYWGQSAIGNGVSIAGGQNTRPATVEQQGLASYCDLGYYQTMNIAFLYDFGGGDGHWGLDLSSIGRYDVSAGGVVSTTSTLIGGPVDPSVFTQVGADIQHCQSKGIKVILSIGGDMHSPYQFIPGDGVKYANILFNSFLQGNSSQRPFGNAILDGVEFDVEKTGPAYTQEQVIMLQTLRKLSPKSLYSAVPQCYLNGGLGDSNTGPVIQAHPELLDYLVIQFYNNPSCSYPFGFNFNVWKTYYAGPIVIGLAGDATSAITGGFLNAGQLQAVVDGVMTDSQFYGISVYDVSSSNPAFSTYSQTIRNALDGKRVGSGYPPQGPFTDYTMWPQRCGTTWTYANETCGLPACIGNSQCADPTQLCFSYMSRC
ncbi:hypothetical protein HDU98_008572 [Podochytrium sp. JEL0797]|nr:hypothetical protein HDU98_008572 [Podochytrium sp. JEL0797]